MQRSTIGLIWIGGLVLAALFYVIGPDRFLDQCIVALDALNEAIHTLVISLGAQAYDVVHALALALLIVFVALGLLAARRGLGGGWMMVVIPVLFLFLVWRPFAYGPTPIGRWLTALVLALVGAVSMTRRLTGPMPPPSGPWAAPRRPADRT